MFKCFHSRFYKVEIGEKNAKLSMKYFCEYSEDKSDKMMSVLMLFQYCLTTLVVFPLSLDQVCAVYTNSYLVAKSVLLK